MYKLVRHPASAIAMMWFAFGLGVTPAIVHGDNSQRKGFAAHYRPGLMEKVARRRGLKVVPCMVASPHDRIGKWLKVHSPGQQATLKCRVTDVPRQQHRAALIKRKIVVELDWESAKILCGIKRPREKPPSACKVLVTALR